jgi:predicted NUDIX family phosphoesterase
MSLNRTDKIKNKALYKDEMVYCISASMVENIDKEFKEDKNIKNSIWNLYDNKGKYMLRADVEGLVELYQLVPYITIINSKKEFLTIKSKKSNNISIGFCSHIKPEICGYNDIVFKACFDIMVKEFSPFISTPLSFKGYFKTFTETTKGHLGLWFVCVVDDIDLKNTDDYEHTFMTEKELIDAYGRLETWSKIALNYFVENKNAQK